MQEAHKQPVLGPDFVHLEEFGYYIIIIFCGPFESLTVAQTGGGRIVEFALGLMLPGDMPVKRDDGGRQSLVDWTPVSLTTPPEALSCTKVGCYLSPSLPKYVAEQVCSCDVGHRTAG